MKDVVEYAKKLNPSKRGELEITDLLKNIKNKKNFLQILLAAVGHG